MKLSDAISVYKPTPASGDPACTVLKVSKYTSVYRAREKGYETFSGMVWQGSIKTAV